ncbi:chitinase [Ochrobactrum chromiisoli]|uniref:Chitinase n=1 Tax=Ochrobactrum chromiisoli TaxID=2993941 RepID=A0ABT3QN72_9HYPH|nr:chitinase [Ochrobactrum chromiisoli]MCX2697059.1 chitinase [Ochrobactrum chromiisoli]
MSTIRNPTTFFSYIRRAPFGGRLTQGQIDGIHAILAESEKRRVSDEDTAYMLATAFHETGGKMQPIRENLNYTTAEKIRKTWPTRFKTNASAEPFVRKAQKLANYVYGGRLGNTAPNDGWIYRGDGLPQLTGKDNFEKFGVKPGMSLLTSVRVMFDGMIKGMFTGKKLSDYFNDGIDDPIGARAIVNGTDKAKLIAGYHKNFLDSIVAANEFDQPADISPALATADDVKPSASGSVKSLLGGVFGTAGLSAILGVDNPWGFGVAALLLTLGFGALFMFASGRWSVNVIKGK